MFYHEAEEERHGWEEVPDVVVVEEIEQDAVLVQPPRLGRRQLWRHNNNSNVANKLQ